jgi:hypothetical protein
MSGEQLSDANTPPLVYERLVLRLENRQKKPGVQELKSQELRKRIPQRLKPGLWSKHIRRLKPWPPGLEEFTKILMQFNLQALSQGAEALTP